MDINNYEDVMIGACPVLPDICYVNSSVIFLCFLSSYLVSYNSLLCSIFLFLLCVCEVPPAHAWLSPPVRRRETRRPVTSQPGAMCCFYVLFFVYFRFRVLFCFCFFSCFLPFLQIFFPLFLTPFVLS